MLEHSAMYLNVPPQYEDDTSFFPDFYTRLGPCELQDPVWAKMSALATGVNKKRKKSETKPQAQINKCNNEKRRREQENIYIEELAELISANFADMSSLSVKPDKCAILQETVNQIRSIKQRESASQSSDPVQQGEVSSSRPTILSNEVYGPLLLEALEGFLFVVNAEGKVEHVTENVSNYIKFTRDEIFGKSIYNFIHLGDHARFSATLMPMTIGWLSDQTSNRSRSLTVRFQVKPPDDQDVTVEEKQQRVSCYELMHISSTQLRDQVTVTDDEGCDSGPYLLCVASRISHRDKATAGIEQFTTKLDTSGKVIGVDVSGVSAQYSHFIRNKELMDRLLRDLVPQQEVHKLNAHLRETVSTGQHTSAVYRLQIGQDKYVQVQTKSKLFKTNPHATPDTDFIMATHSIVGEYDAIGPSDPGGGGTSSVGGPLMPSVVNGTRNGTAPVSSGSDSSTASSNTALMNAGNASSFTPYIENEFTFVDIFPTSTFELDPPSSWTEPRPDSRQSATPVSTPTPRPPSNPAYSPATTVAQSPLAPFQPSPSTPAAPNPYNSNFPFSPLSEPNYNVEEQKDTKGNVLEEASSMIADSGRLRNLLTKPPNVADSSANNDADGRNKHRILKGLLNQQDEDDNGNDHRTSPRGLINRGSAAGSSELPKTSTAGGNNMLLKLLNDRSDDDDHLEAKAGVKNKSELLQQLLKTENRENEDEKKNESQSHEDSLLRSLGFTSSPSPPGGEGGRNRKRPSDDRDDPTSSKRTSDGSQVSSTGATTGSKLMEKNRMLASLLANKPNNEQPIPHIPVSILSATPQDILPRISLADTMKTSKSMATRSTTSVTQQRAVVNKNTMQDNLARMGGRQANSYLPMLQHPNNIHQQRTADNRQMNQVDSGSYTSPATSSTDGNMDASGWGDNNNVHSNDPLLSDILDQVMDIVPDEVERVFAHGEGQQTNNFQNELSEKMAINIIQKSLMQCESAVKSPSSPTISLPGTPPAYSPATMTTQNNQMRQFPPPPNYPQASFIPKQRIPVRQGAPQYGSGAIANAQQLLLQQQRKQQEERRRLLQQQQQQELLIPSNATAAEINSGLQNIDSLINNSVAPNVSLQRSASLPESQLSPGYGGQLSQQNQRINSQQSYSPHSQLVSPIGQQGGFSQTSAANYQQAGARLSPQFNQQMALRQAYPQANAQGQNWQQSQQARLSLQNPMLNAQLTRAPNQSQQAQQQQQQQQQRSLNSPGTVTSRHSPYPQDSFPPPTSPNSAAFNQSQYLRLQRANSVPTATTQLPGGLGSPRPYGREHHPHPYPPIPNPHHNPMMYQQDSSQYCYDQTGLQLAYNGADRGRAPPHLQAGVSGSGPTSEFVRQELRAVVGARTGQAQTAPNRTQSQLLNQQQVDLEALGLTFEMPTTGASDSPKLWGAMGGSDMGSMSPQPTTSRSSMEEARPGDHSNKSSLLQKLLSE